MENTAKNTYLAVDFGGGSGRVIAGSLVRGRLEYKEIYRFVNRQVKLGNHIYWDFPALFEEMKNGLKVAARSGYAVKGIGIDTWGVDFGLIDRKGNLLGNPVCYRDNRTEGMPEKVFRLLDRHAHYQHTGIQVMPINTLFQLYSLKETADPQLEAADKLLFMPDLFSYFLTGTANTEYSIASTSELLDACKRCWSVETIQALGLPEHLFCPLAFPGQVRGRLTEELAAETGLGQVDVIAVGSHDTASAVAAIPATTDNVAFLSSGTWSLLGVELAEPILTDGACKAQFTNEGGVGGRICFLQNITGLWILQSLIRQWTNRGWRADYDYLIAEAEKVTDTSTIEVDAPDFLHPADMETAIAAYCQRQGTKAPVTQGEYVRCVLQSLAMRYHKGLQELNKLLPQPVECLHIIGGGSRNRLLNRLTEEALGIPVYPGPVEATALGNLLVQAEACGSDINKEEIFQL